MDVLSANEVRVIGVLLEKALTTPDQYPLSLNALKTGCNQKSNREPVVELSDNIVQDTCNALIRKRLVIEEGAGPGSRVNRYRHRFCNTEFSELQLSDKEVALLCVLFLRGPQTPGELRTRSQRLCHFDQVSEVESSLNELAGREEPLVTRLPRLPGKREHRYQHLFQGQKDLEGIVEQPLSQNNVEHNPANSSANNSSTLEEDYFRLEARVTQLEQDLQQLRRSLENQGG